MSGWSMTRIQASAALCWIFSSDLLKSDSYLEKQLIIYKRVNIQAQDPRSGEADLLCQNSTDVMHPSSPNLLIPATGHNTGLPTRRYCPG